MSNFATNCIDVLHTKGSVCDNSFASVKIVKANTRLQYCRSLTVGASTNAKVGVRCGYNSKTFTLRFPGKSNDSFFEFQSFNRDFLLAQTENLKVGEC